MRDIAVPAALMMASLFLPGCKPPAVTFPARPMAPSDANRIAYDTDGDGELDVALLLNPAGRADTLGYDLTDDGQVDRRIRLDAVGFARCRHLVIVLDGFAHEVVERYRRDGGLRAFHPPTRVVAPYPTMTDLCFQDLFAYMPVSGFESLYYDRDEGHMVGGAKAYLHEENLPYNRLLNYRADMLLDAVSYVAPWGVFVKEVHDIKRVFDERRTQEVRAYIVSSAGVSTRSGEAGQIDCLRLVERLVHQVLFETRGLTKVTLLADHGHSYTPGTMAPIAEHLRGRGWRITDSLTAEKDVAFVRFGVETYASFSTRSPTALARDLRDCTGVELATAAEGDCVRVFSPDGEAVVRRTRDGRFAYEPVTGDPLELKPILGGLSAGPDGGYDADALLAATIEHEYPAPLQRLWRAHFALVENPGDVTVSLADAYVSGSATYAAWVDIASTHGGLNRRNSVTFIMSTAGKLPDPLRSRDVPAAMQRMTGRRFPYDR